ncbi:MAG: hypothetical protein N2316_03955 [Spirochaetes bacterium]|nr:hypothetical protein [Spirochaetota bacterium]
MANEYTQIIHSVPFFRHCTSKELDHFVNCLRLSKIKKNQVVDLKNNNSINIIIDGIFRVEVYGKKDYIFLTPGSFFGDFPFATMKNRGTVRAISNATLAHLNNDDLYFYLLRNYRCLRGYIKCLEMLGFEIIDAGKELFRKKTKIIAVFSYSEQAGKSTFATSLATCLSQYGKTIILDMSYTGSSAFDVVGKKIPPPISQKEANAGNYEPFINSRIATAMNNFDMLNVVHHSQLRIEPTIISPLFLALSKTYEYIIIDISNEDDELRDCVLEQSDYIIPIIVKEHEMKNLFPVFDSNLKDGQQVLYVTNHYKHNFRFKGSFVFEKIEENNGFALKSFTSAIPEKLVEFIKKPKKAIIFATYSPDGLHYGWFLELIKSNNPFEIFVASGFAVIPFLFFLITETSDHLNSILKELFEKYLSKIVDICFPHESIFSNKNAVKYAKSLFTDLRVEYFINRGLFFFTSTDGSKKIFSTGNVADMFVLALSHFPLFKELTIANGKYYSNFFYQNYFYESLLRMGIDQTYNLRIMGNDDFTGIKKILPWYVKYFRHFTSMNITSPTLLKTNIDYVINIAGLNSIEKIALEINNQANKFLQENNLI